jgi:MSHA pilin protein MshD
MEALFATAVLAFVVAALSQAIVVGQMQTYDAMHSGRAVALAEAMMEEVLVLPYDDPGGGVTIGPDDGETTRQDFDDIDDYHGFSEAADALADAEGNLYADLYQRFNRRVTVTADDVDVAAFGASQPGLTITVTVQEGDDGRAWTVSRFVPEPSE